MRQWKVIACKRIARRVVGEDVDFIGFVRGGRGRGLDKLDRVLGRGSWAAHPDLVAGERGTVRH